MLKYLLIILALTYVATAQGYSQGVAKSTWAASNPTECLNFYETYMGADAESSTCNDGVCKCGIQGRGYMKYSTSNTKWGVHTINCKYHPYGTTSLMEMEEQIQATYNNYTAYSPFMEYNTGYWYYDLTDFVERFNEDDIQWLGLKWTLKKTQYFSILANVCGFQTIEIISDKLDEQYTSLFKDSDQRMTFHNKKTVKPEDSEVVKTDLYPLKISRASNSYHKIKAFYTPDIFVTLLDEQEFDDGSILLTYMWDYPTKGIELQFWFKRQNEVEQPKGSMTVKKYEDYMMSVHRQIMTSSTCGFDQWIDNHYGYTVDTINKRSGKELATLKNFLIKLIN